MRNAPSTVGIDARIVWEIHDGNEGLHRDADGQTDAGPRDPGAIGGEVDNARDLGRSETRLAIDRSRNRIADNRLANFSLHSAEGRDGIGERRRRALNRVAGRGVALHHDRTHRRAGIHHVGKRDAVDVNIVRSNGVGRTKTKLPGERDVLVYVVVRNEHETDSANASPGLDPERRRP